MYARLAGSPARRDGIRLVGAICTFLVFRRAGKISSRPHRTARHGRKKLYW
jgi:hypothetical protein